MERAVAAYIEQVTGERPEFTPLPEAEVARLPVYLGQAWHLKRMVLLGHEVILALPKVGTTTGLSHLAKDCAVLATHLGREVIPVIPDIRSYGRRQLVQKRVSFITPGKQLFLPIFLADFREVFSAVPQPHREKMSWISQVILLRHLVHGGITARPLAEVAGTLGYTAMAVTHGVRELVSLGLCAKIPQGRAKMIQFDLQPRALWDRALAHLRSPIVRRCPVAMAGGRMGNVHDAGLSALSEKTNLAYDGPRILALSNRDLKHLLSEGTLETQLDENDANLVLEGWSYPPLLVSAGPAVDDLSLYLSLREDPDERVQMALTNLMEQRTW